MTLTKLKASNAQQKLMDAFKNGSEDAFANAMEMFADTIQADIIDEAKAAATDANILAARGQLTLTSEEMHYYQDVIDNEGFDGVEELVPATVFEHVFDDLTNSHGLLQKIQFVNTTGISEFITSRGVNPAWWGKLTEAIKQVLDNGFDVVNVKQMKLSGYIPVSNAMLKLGPTWLDKYVRTVLVEALQIALEQAIVDGTGNNEPIGMMRDLKNVTDGVHAEKTAIDLKDFSPESLGNLMSQFSQIHLDGVDQVYYRNVKPEDVVMVVNPADYWAKVYPKITVQIMDGSYRTGLPLPFDIETSVAVPIGKGAAGVGSDYFMGMGSTLEIATSDENKFIEDQRVYRATQYANGAPKNNDSFIVFNLPADSTTATDPKA